MGSIAMKDSLPETTPVMERMRMRFQRFIPWVVAMVILGSGCVLYYLMQVPNIAK